MQQKQRKKRTALLTGLLTLCTLWMGWGQMTVSYDFSGPGAVSGFDADPPIALDAKIGFSSHKNDGTANPALNSGQLRLYQNATKGGSIKIYAQNGVTITNVVVYASSSTGPAEYTVDGGSAIPITISGGSYTINSISGTSEVEFYQKDGNGSNRIYVDSFDVTYTLPSSGPILLTNTTTLTNFEYIEGNGPSASQSLDVSGINLDPAAGTINVAAPANFEVSLDDNTFADDVDIAYTAGEFTDETVYVRLKSGLAENTYNGDITISGGDAADVTVAVDGEVTPIPQPELLTDPTSITGLNYMDGNGPSAAQQFELSGVALDNSNVTLTAPADFEISEDDNTYSSSITLSAYDGIPTDIYVRLQSGLAENTYNGDITISGGGITGNITVALSGEVTPFIDQYAGVGVFELVTSLAELEDGYYVITETTDAFAMNNIHNGTYLAPEAVTVTSNTIVNPGTHLVWYIEANGAGHTIYNDDIEKYVSYTGSSNNIQIVDNVTADNQRWSVTYNTSAEFIFENLAVNGRILQYNATSGQERFAAYSSNQHKLHLYKWVELNDPVLTADPMALSGLNYTEGTGPSAAQTFEISGLNLNNSDVIVSVSASSDFELSADDVTYGDTITLTAFDGTATTIYARLKAGLVADNYTDDVAIAGGGATAISVNLEGDVVEPFDLPYFNGLRDQTDWDQAQLDGFTFTNESFESGAGGYVRLEDLGSNIASPAIDFSNYDIIKVSFDLTTYGGNSGQELTVYVSDNDGISYTALGSFAVPVSYETFTEYIDVSGSVSTTGRIKFEMSDGSNSIRFRDLDMDIYSGFVYSGGTWTPSDPLTNATPTDNILIANGTAVLDADFEINNITVANGATLEVENVLKVNGDIENNGAIVFVSSSVANTAQFDTFTGTITGNGTVTAERFIPARRAFRLLSAPVTSTGSINDNWQEGANNTGTNYPADNQNPNPGYGTHITGSTTGANGFDATPSGNPSLFYLDVANQSWEPFANTDNTTIQAGVPHRLMVRGGRDINVTSNSAAPSDTRLRTTGSLHTGPQTQSYTVAAADDLVLFGNPYQASVDMDNVLTNATNINPNFYYIWDPTLGGIPTPGQPGGRGAYVTVDTSDWSNIEGSAIGQYLQPHQAALVRAAAAGTVEINFAETDKAVGNLVTVFSAPENTAAISLKLYEANAYDQNNTVSDALKIKFAAEGNNAIDAYDAIKIGNLDENLAIVNDGNYLSVESRAWPTEDDIIPLFINQHRHQDYVFVAHTQGLEEVDAYLRDHYLMEELLLDNDTDTTYAFSISQDDPNSMATDRFEIYFVEAPMNINDNAVSQVMLYPNPSESTFFLQSTALSGKQITVNISNMLGQMVYEQKTQFEDSGRVEVTPQKLPAGVYLVTLQDTQNNAHTIQWIKK